MAATSLLSLFPQGLYNLAQAVLVPFLVDKESIGAPGLTAVRSMMVMDPPPAYRVPLPYPCPRQHAPLSAGTEAGQRGKPALEAHSVSATWLRGAAWRRGM